MEPIELCETLSNAIKEILILQEKTKKDVNTLNDLDNDMKHIVENFGKEANAALSCLISKKYNFIRQKRRKAKNDLQILNKTIELFKLNKDYNKYNTYQQEINALNNKLIKLKKEKVYNYKHLKKEEIRKVQGFQDNAIVLNAFHNGKCKICNNIIQYHNSNVPKICEDCANIIYDVKDSTDEYGEYMSKIIVNKNGKILCKESKLPTIKTYNIIDSLKEIYSFLKKNNISDAYVSYLFTIKNTIVYGVILNKNKITTKDHNWTNISKINQEDHNIVKKYFNVLSAVNKEAKELLNKFYNKEE